MLGGESRLDKGSVKSGYIVFDGSRNCTGSNGVSEIHHQHLWSLDGEQHVLTAHIVADHDGGFGPDNYCAIKQSIAMALEQYPLAHTTIEIELTEEACRDQPVPSQTDQH